MSIFHRSAWKSMCVSGDVSISVIDCSAKLLPVCAECQKQYRKFWNQWNETRFRSCLSLGNTLYEPALCCSPKFVIFTGRNGRVCVHEQCLSVQQSSISCHRVCCSIFQIEEDVLHIGCGTDFVSHANVIVCMLSSWLSCADYSHSRCNEFWSIMKHRQFSHCFITRPNFYLL